MASASQNNKWATANVKKRQAKATSAQIDFMVDYFIQNPQVATGKFHTLHGKSDFNASWEKLAEELNKMNEDGKSKDVKSWKSTWRDNKSIVSRKIARIRANQMATGNVGGPPPKLTEREEKILGLMGFDYVEGLQSADAFPEEQPNALELLADRKEEMLEIAADVLTVRSNSDTSGVSYTDYEILEDLDEIATDPMTEGTVPCEPARVPKIKPTKLNSSSSRQLGVSRRDGAPKITRRGCQRLSTQLESAREDFTTLAERQIACMEVFADVMKQMAENDRQRNEILKTLADTMNKRDETLSDLTVLIKDCVSVLKNK